MALEFRCKYYLYGDNIHSTMVRCSGCGEENDLTFSYCSRCGEPLAGEKRERDRYGAADATYSDPIPSSEVIPREPYMLFYNWFGTRWHMTRRKFSLIVAYYVLTAILIVAIKTSSFFDIIIVASIAVASLLVPIWLIGRYNANNYEP